jgi:hypothetical protein
MDNASTFLCQTFWKRFRPKGVGDEWKGGKDYYLFKRILDDIGYEYAIIKDNERVQGPREIKGGARVQLKINYKDKEKNKYLFECLEKHKKQIENDFKGEENNFESKLEWFANGIYEKPSHYSLILSVVSDKGLKDKEDWDCTQDKMIKAMARFEKAIGKHVKDCIKKCIDQYP